MVSHLIVVMNAVECVIVRFGRSPAYATTVGVRIVLTDPVSVFADAVNHHSNFFHPYSNLGAKKPFVSSPMSFDAIRKKI